LAETFDNLRKFPNPEKMLAITKMRPPKSLHDMQKFTRCMATLSRFIS
jgi:hypothetical protein